MTSRRTRRRARSRLTPEARLAASITLLEDRHPELSARRRTGGRVRYVALGIGVVVAACAIAAPLATLTTVIALISLLYVVALGYRVRLISRATTRRDVLEVSDDDARAIPDADLPVYSVLVPAFHEAASVPQLLRALDALEYPKSKLNVMLLLEADDDATIAAARANPRDYVELVLVPPSEPRTKPKALNYGLLEARGKLVTIYDVEDVPEPLQLRRVAAVFRDLDKTYACVQARLVFYNSRQNQITKWFTLDYAIWFDWFLPGLVADADVVPLSGTSNHFRTKMLVDAGAWDPFNVTEDADLGVRLRRLGHAIALIDSDTGEEATSDFVNWVKQRSRWYKGYLQTWIVHLRTPRATWRDLGPRGFASFNFFVGGAPVLAVCNVGMWAFTIAWIVGQPGWVQAAFPRIVYYPSLFCFVVGNFVCIYMGMMSARETRNSDLMPSALLLPVYWLMMSLAAVKATVQLIAAPSFWEKTAHGMARTPATSGPAPKSIDLTTDVGIDIDIDVDIDTDTAPTESPA